MRIVIFKLQKIGFLNNSLKIAGVTFFLVVMIGVSAFAQEGEKSGIPLEKFYAERKGVGAFRKILRNFHVGVSTGYGRTTLSHKLNGFGIYQASNLAPSLFIITNPPTTTTRYANWINNLVSDPSTKPAAFAVASDTAKIGFKGHAWNIPLKLTLHYEFKNYRIGGGYSYDYMHVGELNPISYSNKISSISLNKPGGWVRKYFGMAGVSFYRLDQYLFTADINIGNFKPKSNFNTAVVKPSLYYNLGVTVERDFSEYLKGFVRPSYEIKSYTVTVPENGKSIKHNMNAFYLNFGFTYTLPELPRCFKSDCHAQINHAHGNREYRSRRHPIYKKQNPGYGENYPKLIRYKGKNKSKLNPY